ncbi:N-acetylmuramoyl-L-alanine amidase [Xanthomonas tesorieronis]|uniref:N-acetylmuramoyl-L-alanine amidase n=1 Tax=Xanthomonas tesorieronis TaxID=3160839 RepID=UPI0035121361
MTSPDQLFVTASMTRPDHKVTGAELARIHRSQGFSKIAVHFVVERDGTVHHGRTLDEPGCLAAGANHRSLQVCLVGGVDESLTPTDNFSEQQRSALRRLVRKHGLPVAFDRVCPLQET